jgi:hypothetical protein
MLSRKKVRIKKLQHLSIDPQQMAFLISNGFVQNDLNGSNYLMSKTLNFRCENNLNIQPHQWVH